jgi:hypothetical protein
MLERNFDNHTFSITLPLSFAKDSHKFAVLNLVSETCCHRDCSFWIESQSLFVRFTAEDNNQPIKLLEFNDESTSISFVSRGFSNLEIWLDNAIVRYLLGCAPCEDLQVKIGSVSELLQMENSHIDSFECLIGSVDERFTFPEIPVQLEEENPAELNPELLFSEKEMSPEDVPSNQG